MRITHVCCSKVISYRHSRAKRTTHIHILNICAKCTPNSCQNQLNTLLISLACCLALLHLESRILWVSDASCGGKPRAICFCFRFLLLLSFAYSFHCWRMCGENLKRNGKKKNIRRQTISRIQNATHSHTGACQRDTQLRTAGRVGVQCLFGVVRVFALEWS